MKKIAHTLILLVLSGVFASCSTSSNSTTHDQPTIIIDSMTFIPTEISASAGETILVINDDDTTHTITSESAQNAFDNSGDFDTGFIVSGEATTFDVPSTAQPGDTFFWYCDLHEASMATPNGVITVE